jgi:transposase
MYIGIDLHKKYSVVTTMDINGNIMNQKRVEHDSKALDDFISSIDENDNIAMEATTNWYYFYELLESKTQNISLAHPAKTRIIAEAKVKNDKVDSKMLAHLLRTDLLPKAYIPTRETRDLRELLRYRASLVRFRTQIKNKIHAILSKNGIASPYSDLFGKAGMVFLKQIELRESFRESYRQSVDGYLTIIQQINIQISDVSKDIDQIAKLDNQAQLLMSISGIGAYSALLILSEIGDVSRFHHENNIVSYAGLAPSVHSSGGKTYHGHITKQGSRWLRWILIEAVPHVVDSSPAYKRLYTKLVAKKGKGTAKVAIARKLLIAIYYMLQRGERFKMGQ